MSKAKHTDLPWFSYQQYPDRFYIGGYRRGSLCISIGRIAPNNVVTASGDESITEDEAIANRDLIVTAVNHHQELITRLYNLVNAVDTRHHCDGSAMDLMAAEARETLKKVTPK